MPSLETITQQTQHKSPSFLQKLRTSLITKLAVPLTAGTLFFAGCADDKSQTSCLNDFDCPGEQVCLDNICANEGTCYSDFDCQGKKICIENVCTETASPPATTKILDQEAANSLISISEDKKILTFEADSRYAQSLVSGDVIVAGITNKTPYGLLRKVVYADYASQIVVETEHARLEDAVEKGTIAGSIAFSADSAGKADTAALPLSAGFKVNFDNTNLYQNMVYLDGSLSASIEPNFEIDFDWFKLEKLRYEIQGQQELELKVIGEISQTISHELPPIEPIQFPPVVFAIPTVPPIPVVITPNLTVTFGVHAQGQLSVETSVNQFSQFTTGLEYQNGTWQEIKDFNNNFDFQEPNFSETQAEIEVYAKPKFSLEFYDIAGPYGAVKGYVKGEVTLSDTWCTLSAGLDVSAGVHVEVLGKTFADYEANIYNYETVLATCGEVCQPKDHKSCYDADGDGIKDPVWFDSCNSLDEVIDYCNSNEYCESGQCKTKPLDCSPNKDHKKCYNGDVWWFDACNDPYTKHDNCSSDEKCENKQCVPKQVGCDADEYQCNNGECIPQSYVCDDYNDCSGGEDEQGCTPSCTDECDYSGQKKCSDNGWKECGDYDSDSCVEWSSSQECTGETCISGGCSNRWVNYGPGLVLDQDTGLKWEKGVAGQTLVYWDFFDHCEALTLGGYSGWRVPSLTELESILIDNIINNCHMTPLLDKLFSGPAKACGIYYSSTTNGGKIFAIDFTTGEQKLESKSSAWAQNTGRCVHD